MSNAVNASNANIAHGIPVVNTLGLVASPPNGPASTVVSRPNLVTLNVPSLPLRVCNSGFIPGLSGFSGLPAYAGFSGLQGLGLSGLGGHMQPMQSFESMQRLPSLAPLTTLAPFSLACSSDSAADHPLSGGQFTLLQFNQMNQMQQMQQMHQMNTVNQMQLQQMQQMPVELSSTSMGALGSVGSGSIRSDFNGISYAPMSSLPNTNMDYTLLQTNTQQAQQHPNFESPETQPSQLPGSRPHSNFDPR